MSVGRYIYVCICICLPSFPERNAQTFALTDVRLPLTLTLIHPASKWMYWATLRRHSGLFRVATSASSQVSSILDKSLLTMLLQLVCGRPGPLLILALKKI